MTFHPLIAAWAVNAEKCFIYMRDEYPAVLEILAKEISALETSGIVESGYIDLRRGAGAYICKKIEHAPGAQAN